MSPPPHRIMIHSANDMKSLVDLFDDAKEDARATTETTNHGDVQRAYALGDINTERLTLPVCKMLWLTMQQQNDSNSAEIVAGTTPG